MGPHGAAEGAGQPLEEHTVWCVLPGTPVPTAQDRAHTHHKVKGGENKNLPAESKQKQTKKTAKFHFGNNPSAPLSLLFGYSCLSIAHSSMIEYLSAGTIIDYDRPPSGGSFPSSPPRPPLTHLHVTVLPHTLHTNAPMPHICPTKCFNT